MTASRPPRPSTPPTPPTSTKVRATTAERAARVRFRRATALMVMTLVLPGSAQIAAGNRRVGRIAVKVWGATWALGLVALLGSLVHHQFAFWLASNTWLLLAVRWALMGGAVAWAALFMDAWRLGNPLSLGLQHRRAVVGINGVLCLSVVATMLFAAHVVGTQRSFIQTVFGSGAASAATDGRFNVLLLGGDSGAGRWGLRPDSITIASVDALTGRSVLISLPRNMANFPFAPGSVMAEQFPEGFDCEGCYLNAVSTWAQDNAELFPDSDNPGIDATVMAVEGITGLEINYWAMVNLAGFKKLVDAVGGVTLTVRQPIPVGLPSDDFYTHIEPGRRRLNGFETLWYARARYDSDDYSRMARQKCVMAAMLGQISPQKALRNFQAIAQASSEMISTNVPTSEVDLFLDLALKARGQKISTLSLVPPLINTGDPDIDLIHRKVDEALDRAEGAARGDAPKDDKSRSTKAGKTSSEGSGQSSQEAAPQATTGGSLGSLKEGYAANQAEDLDRAC